MNRLAATTAALLLGTPTGVTRLPGADPDLPDGSAKARRQLAAFRMPAGLKAELWAAEPMLASPVALTLDEKNRVYVAEEYRFNRGTEENRGRPFLLDDDLQMKTVADRLAAYKKHADKFPGGMDYFTRHADQVRLLEDTTGSGRANKSSVFAGGFNGPLDGLAAGVLVRDGNVYFTCIPNLWLLKDTAGKGVADVRTPLLTGFGVCNAFLGHDLHGLTWGPDGKLYFSVGDRGFHVVTKEGTTLSGPRTGAVFRCDPDGANLEVVHRGLRNPQELAFDQHGNLFADDNNCDKGDDARLVYVVDGGESGWNMAYQTIPGPYTAGPWFAERLWHLPHAGQPAYIVPPAGKIGTGPSGFTFTSGTSLPPRYKNSFLMCNYTGNGGIEAFRVKPAGAGFVADDYHDFLKPVMATDCEFGYDGKLYVSDFVNLDWSGKSLGGRVYTVFDPAKLADPVVQETKELFAAGFNERPAAELAKLLAHPDQRVRQRAQFALAARGGPAAAEVFVAVAARGPDPLARLHAVWGLGQMGGRYADGLRRVDALLTDGDPEVRAQAAKVLGDRVYAPSAVRLVAALADPEPRVKFFAAQALGRLKHRPAVGPLFDLVKSNADADPYLRHAAVVALVRIGDGDAVAARAADPSPAVRLAVVLAQRRLADRRVAAAFADADPFIRTEAARAIHDLPLDDALPQLAATLPQIGEKPIPDGDALARRAISANYRLGGADHAKAVLGVVGNGNFSSAVRAEAVAALRDWPAPPPRDRVTGFWRPLPARDGADVRAVVEAGFPTLLAKTSGPLQTAVLELVVHLKVKADEGLFDGWAKDRTADPNTRAAALRFLAARKAKSAAARLADALTDPSPVVRSAARELTAKADPAKGAGLVAAVLADATAPAGERQRAVSLLPGLNKPGAGLLDKLAADLAAGKITPELRLDVADAIKAAPTPAREVHRTKYEAGLPPGPQGKFRDALLGGDADRGREIFFNHTAAQCVRCHKAGGVGGTAGPDLAGLTGRHPEKTREFLRESLLSPSAKIAPGFGTVTLTLLDGRSVTGTLLSDGPAGVTVQTADGAKVAAAAADIESRSAVASPMPSVEKTLSPREVRDLIEYLTTLK